jgi:hypothetical protein
MTEIHVRVGTVDDVDGVMTVALAACEENAFLSPNPAKILQDVWAALSRESGIVGIIGDPGKPIEGVVLLRMGPLWYTDEACIEERAIYVVPEFRSAKGGRARKLIQFSKKVSIELRIPLAIGVLSNARTQGKVRLYEREFGVAAGAYFLFGGNTGEQKVRA